MKEPKIVRILDRIRAIVMAIAMIPLVLLEIVCSVIMVIMACIVRFLDHIIAYGCHTATMESYSVVMGLFYRCWESTIDLMSFIFKPD